jgi:dolichol-phosphate mannosyltransferase
VNTQPTTSNVISIVIPACNEEDAIRLLPERLYPTINTLSKRSTVELLLVDDGSIDSTWVELERLRDQAPPCSIALLRHGRNRGLGAALQTGVAHARGRIIVTVDADGTYPFPIIEELVDAVLSGADVATASPYHRDGAVEGVSGVRLLFSRGASLLYRLLVDRSIATYTAMVRAYRVEVLAASEPGDSGFLYVAKTLVEARRRRARIVEIPAVLSRREVGVSKARLMRITRAHLRYMCHIATLRLRGGFWLGPFADERIRALEITSHG